jgi:hypothetical protein
LNATFTLSFIDMNDVVHASFIQYIFKSVAFMSLIINGNAMIVYLMFFIFLHLNQMIVNFVVTWLNQEVRHVTQWY